MDYEAILGELLAIAERFLGADADAVRPLLTSAELSPQGLRTVLNAVRQCDVPGFTPAQISAMARAMVLYVADRVTAA